MKFFTTAWWRGGCKNAAALFESYGSYFASVRERLPERLVELHERHTLHDARVEQVLCLFQSGSVEIALLGWNQALSFPVQYRLTFQGVSHFEQCLPSGRECDAELGDLGYWECEATSGGTEVRMLFVSSAEFHIVFQGFEFAHVAVRSN